MKISKTNTKNPTHNTATTLANQPEISNESSLEPTSSRTPVTSDSSPSDTHFNLDAANAATTITELRHILESSIYHARSKFTKAEMEFIFVTFSKAEQLLITAEKRVAHLEGRLGEREALTQTSAPPVPDKTPYLTAARKPAQPKSTRPTKTKSTPLSVKLIIHSSATNDADKLKTTVSTSIRDAKKIRVSSIRKLKSGDVIVEAPSDQNVPYNKSYNRFCLFQDTSRPLPALPKPQRSYSTGSI